VFFLYVGYCFDTSPVFNLFFDVINQETQAQNSITLMGSFDLMGCSENRAQQRLVIRLKGAF